MPVYRDEERGDVTVDKPSPRLSLSMTPLIMNGNKQLGASPVRTSYSTYEPSRKLAAFVGPVSPKNANAIYDRLKSPARLRQSPNNLDILRSDDFKGYERIVRQFTDEMKLPWTEFWAFLNGFSNLKSREGLLKLEIYLEQKKIQNSLDFQKKTAVNLKNEQETQPSRNLFNPVITNKELVEKLEEFIQIVDQLKSTIDLKENILSQKYEQLIRSTKDKRFTSTAAATLGISDTNIEPINTTELQELLERYMNTILQVCRINKDSTQCYFDIYKNSKLVFELLNYEHLHKHLTFSPKNDLKFNSSAVKAPISNEPKRVFQIHNKTPKR